MGATPSVESAARGAKSSGVLEFLKSGPKKLLIGGKWVPSKSGKTFETLNPANEEVLCLVAEGDKVVCRNRWEGTNAKTDRRIEFHGFVEWRFEGEKIAERWATVTAPAELIANN